MHPIDDRTWPNKTEENKSWNEFMEWADEEWPYANVLHKFVYDRLLDYEKIGLLIEFLKTLDGWNDGEGFFVKELTLDYLEGIVKNFKPKEDDEIEKLAIKLRQVCTAYSYEPLKDQWEAIAKKAIEIIKGK